jgi:hypothetical protein
MINNLFQAKVFALFPMKQGQNNALRLASASIKVFDETKHTH